MRWLLVIVALVVGAIVGAGGTFYILEKSRRDSGDIVLAPKYFADNEEHVVVSGSLTGPSIGNPNNSYTISCSKERKACWIASLRQTPLKAISRITAPYELDIIEWTPSEITAWTLAGGELECTKTTVTIGRKRKEVVWVDEPVNQSQPECRNADTPTRRYWIEDSPGWKKFFGKPATG